VLQPLPPHPHDWLISVQSPTHPRQHADVNKNPPLSLLLQENFRLHFGKRLFVEYRAGILKGGEKEGDENLAPAPKLLLRGVRRVSEWVVENGDLSPFTPYKLKGTTFF
jgi:hypothetical protein